MGLTWTEIPVDMQRFIANQKVFFVATAPMNERVNVSPKGLDTLRVLSARSVCYLDLTGSGNETAAHVTENGRMTIMFCAFEGEAVILRLYGKAQVIRPETEGWSQLRPLFSDYVGIRQIFQLDIDRVSTSCGWAVPLAVAGFEERHELLEWSEKQGASGLEDFRQTYNVASIDGLSTGYASDDF